MLYNFLEPSHIAQTPVQRHKAIACMSSSSDRFQARPQERRGFGTIDPSQRQVPPDLMEIVHHGQNTREQYFTHPYERIPTTRPQDFQKSPVIEHDFVLNDRLPPRSIPQASLPHVNSDVTSLRRYSAESYDNRSESPGSAGYGDYEIDIHGRRSSKSYRNSTQQQGRRRPHNQDEFDGPSQLLPLPLPEHEHARSQALPVVPISLDLNEQDQILQKAHDVLSACAYHFIAKYQFPIPVERDKQRVRSPADRDWTEWAFLLKRLATKRRIPARVLYDNQIKQLVTTLENSVAARQAHNKNRPVVREPRDDRYILQLISSGIQVARILMDSLAMQELDTLYAQTEAVILDRRRISSGGPHNF